MKKLLASLLMVPVLAFASGAELHLDNAPDLARDQAALQRGAKTFVTYCLSCHGASSMRYNRLQDIGLTEDDIRQNYMITADKIGEQMRISMQRADAKQWFGVPPPDLTLVARARASEFGSGPDWLYTYLRSFYRDETRPSGWNNVVFPNVGMPHVLWELQGEQALEAVGEEHQLKLVKPGKLTPEQYNATVADLVGFLKYMGEPAGEFRKKLGIGVLIALAILFILSYALKREFWKDIH
jgi:ubiquinol-cytochrome c reductase cytochrome c1 subunit